MKLSDYEKKMMKKKEYRPDVVHGRGLHGPLSKSCRFEFRSVGLSSVSDVLFKRLFIFILFKYGYCNVYINKPERDRHQWTTVTASVREPGVSKTVLPDEGSNLQISSSFIR